MALAEQIPNAQGKTGVRQGDHELDDTMCPQLLEITRIDSMTRKGPRTTGSRRLSMVNAPVRTRASISAPALRRVSALVIKEPPKVMDGSRPPSGYEEIKLTLPQACGLNTMNMFGTGPFITIPFVVAAADPPGPHALIGYAIAAFACINDSLIWAELGSMWPDSGGSYVYLRELYGRNTWGRLCAFIFVWQIMVSGPMEAASGFIATAQYIAYIDGEYSYLHHSGIAFGMCALTIWSLYRQIDDVGTITLILWGFTIAAIIFTLIAGFASVNSSYLETPDDAFSNSKKFSVSMAIAARFAIYDFTGYYDVNFVGDEVQNPARNIPIACIVTCVIVAMCFLLVDVAVIGSLEWDPSKGGYVELITSGAESANFIMAIFCEKIISRGFAIFFTIIVAITIFGSCFSFIIGLAQVPYTAAKDGYFYDFLAHQHPEYKGLSDYSLLFVGALSTIFCFVELEIVIEGMLTMMLFVQFMGQSVGLVYYRYFTSEENQEEAPFSVPLFPVPNIIQFLIFGYILITTDNYIIGGHVPLLEIAILFLLVGVVMYLIWARSMEFWPFETKFTKDVDMPVAFHVTVSDETKAFEKEEKEIQHDHIDEFDEVKALEMKQSADNSATLNVAVSGETKPSEV